MIDIKFLRENPEIVKQNIRNKFQDQKLIDQRHMDLVGDVVKQNIKNKFQDHKLHLVDEVIDLDKKNREAKLNGDNLRAERKSLSAEIGNLMRNGKKDEAESIKSKVQEINSKLEENEKLETEYAEEIKSRMMKIPNIMDASVPIGKDDSENVEVERFGEATVPAYEIPHHADIIARFNGLDKESAGRTSGVGFYYLIGDVARLHEAMLAYARDYMINNGFTYAIPPFMIRSDVVNGVMSFEEMDAMMYKIEGEDLFLIGTSEHSMIGRFKEQLIKKDELPICMTSYSPCFRKEIGSHGLEERGLYRVHQFEKQEMIVLCEPEESMEWYNKMWKLSVDLFRSWNVPVRQLDCCSGDLADLKVKSCDIEAWSPRQQKYFEVCSCSNLGDAQARRLGIRVKSEKGNYYLHTLNNTVVATPRGLIAVIENNYNEDGSVTIPEVLRPYMGGAEKIVPKK